MFHSGPDLDPPASASQVPSLQVLWSPSLLPHYGATASALGNKQRILTSCFIDLLSCLFCVCLSQNPGGIARGDFDLPILLPLPPKCQEEYRQVPLCQIPLFDSTANNLANPRRTWLHLWRWRRGVACCKALRGSTEQHLC